MKKHLLLLLVALLPLLASAYDAEIDGIYYNLSGNEAIVTSGSPKYSGAVVIPSSVTYNDITYSLTSIGDDAFRHCVNLTSITIPNSVTSIGEYAFYSCTSLTDVYCYATTPPSDYYVLYSFDRSYIEEHTTLHVPSGSIDAYKAQEPWKYFKSIVAIE